MLRQISLNNIAIIQQLTVSVEPQLTIITGDTGSGKSLLLDAIAMAFGAKVSAKEIIKAGAARGRIELLFTMANWPNTHHHLQQQLDKIDCLESVNETGGELIITREFSSSGSRSRLNGTPVTKDHLLALRPFLVDCHGQHELSNLFNKAYQRQCLDNTGGLKVLGLRQQVKHAYQKWHGLQQQITQLVNNQVDRARQLDFLQFQANELEQAQLFDPKEDVSLKLALERLSHGEKLQKATLGCVARLTQGLGETATVQEHLRQCERLLKEPATWDNALAPLAERISLLLEECRELSGALVHYAEGVDCAPQAIDAKVDRLDLLEKLKRKYGPSLPQVIDRFNTISTDLQQTQQSDVLLEKLQSECDQANQILIHYALQLSQARCVLATQLQADVTERLLQLALPAVRFVVEFNPYQQGPTADGAEEVIFMFSANPGDPLRPLATVASGGELSRVLLAIKLAHLSRQNNQTNQNNDIDWPHNGFSDASVTMIFDEIDTGISGTAAQAVAECLLQVSRQCGQALVITHQPIVAAVADQHLHVQKTFEYDSVNVKDTPTGVNVTADYIHTKKEKRLSQLSRLASGIDTDDEAVEQFIGRLLHKADDLKALQNWTNQPVVAR
jgi:DNA repair protein RecN (Recombination protein N)